MAKVRPPDDFYVILLKHGQIWKFDFLVTGINRSGANVLKCKPRIFLSDRNLFCQFIIRVQLFWFILFVLLRAHIIG